MTQQLQYGIYGVFDLAYNGGTRPIPIQEISARQAVPARYLEQIFQKLRRAGLVSSKRGPGGGYTLRRSPQEITLADLFRALQDDVFTRGRAGERVAANPEFVWSLIHDGVEQALGRWTLADLCREAARRGFERAHSEPAMYHI